MLVLLKDGHQLPLFIFHSMSGTVDEMMGLVGEMNYGPVIGINARGIRLGEKPCNTVEDMARHYVDSILDVQGTGPYCLAGYSLGGLIAYEVAQQLLKRGHEIAVLTMLDAYLDDATFLMQTLRHAKGGLWNLRKKNPKCDEATLHSIFAMPARMRSVIVKLGEAMATYRPKPYPGSVLFFRASIVHPRWNDSTPIWESLCEQSFRIVEIVGTHKEMIESPNIKDIAFILDLCLASRTEKV